MIEVTFLGVGEAFDETLPNTSLLIRCLSGGSAFTIMLDCGFTAPPQLWKELREPELLDAVWISHFHGDHAFGLPALLVRFWQEKRSKALTIAGQKGIEGFCLKILELAYPGFAEKLSFPIRFLEVEPHTEARLGGLRVRAAENDHPQRDLAFRIDTPESSLFYSGDGKPTPESIALARAARLIIHEAYQIEPESPGHGTVAGSIRMAERCEAETLALVHIHRKARKELLSRGTETLRSDTAMKVIIPEPGHKIEL